MTDATPAARDASRAITVEEIGRSIYEAACAQLRAPKLFEGWAGLKEESRDYYRSLAAGPLALFAPTVAALEAARRVAPESADVAAIRARLAARYDIAGLSDYKIALVAFDDIAHLLARLAAAEKVKEQAEADERRRIKEAVIVEVCSWHCGTCGREPFMPEAEARRIFGPLGEPEKANASAGGRGKRA